MEGSHDCNQNTSKDMCSDCRRGVCQECIQDHSLHHVVNFKEYLNDLILIKKENWEQDLNNTRKLTRTKESLKNYTRMLIERKGGYESKLWKRYEEIEECMNEFNTKYAKFEILSEVFNIAKLNKPMRFFKLLEETKVSAKFSKVIKKELVLLESPISVLEEHIEDVIEKKIKKEIEEYKEIKDKLINAKKKSIKLKKLSELIEVVGNETNKIKEGLVSVSEKNKQIKDFLCSQISMIKEELKKIAKRCNSGKKEYKCLKEKYIKLKRDHLILELKVSKQKEENKKLEEEKGKLTKEVGDLKNDKEKLSNECEEYRAEYGKLIEFVNKLRIERLSLLCDIKIDKQESLNLDKDKLLKIKEKYEQLPKLLGELEEKKCYLEAVKRNIVELFEGYKKFMVLFVRIRLDQHKRKWAKHLESLKNQPPFTSEIQTMKKCLSEIRKKLEEAIQGGNEMFKELISHNDKQHKGIKRLRGENNETKNIIEDNRKGEKNLTSKQEKKYKSMDDSNDKKIEQTAPKGKNETENKELNVDKSHCGDRNPSDEKGTNPESTEKSCDIF